MSDNNRPIPVAAIIEEELTQEQVSAALEAQAEFELVSMSSSLEGVQRKVRDVEPKILILGYEVKNQKTLDLMDDLSIKFPALSLVAIVPKDNPLVAQQAILSGAHAFLVEPFSQASLMSTLRRVHLLDGRRRRTQNVQVSEKAEELEPLQTFTVYSPRGGVGCSTIAINLALAFRELIADRVLLMEGKLLFGHLGLMLNIRAHNDMTDLIPHVNALDAALIKDVVTEHASGIDVLLSPEDVQVAQGVRPEDLLGVMRGIRKMYDFIIIDGGSYLNENTVTLMDLSDRILVITTPDLAALHDVSRFIRVARNIGYKPEKIHVILNRVGILGGVKTNDIEVALHHDVFAQIPEEEMKVLRSLNQGVPFLFRYPRNPLSRSIKKMAKALAQIGLEEKSKGEFQSARIPTKLRSRLSALRAN